MSSALGSKLQSSPATSGRARETPLAAFIDEQYDALDNMHDNRAVLFTGPAGSGKTWLAIEAARREINRATAGACSVSTGCSPSTSGTRSPAWPVCASPLSTRRPSGSAAAEPPIAGPEFWDAELPTSPWRRCLTNEVRDRRLPDPRRGPGLAREPYLDILGLWSKGPGTDASSIRRLCTPGHLRTGDGRHSRERIPGLATFGLTVNCRNLPRIGTVVHGSAI